MKERSLYRESGRWQQFRVKTSKGVDGQREFGFSGKVGEKIFGGPGFNRPRVMNGRKG